MRFIKRQKPGRYQTVQMKVIDQGLRPGVQHTDKAQLSLQTPFRIGGKGLQGLVDFTEQATQ